MKQKAEKPPVVPVNGKEADLSKALPLTIGDAKAMKKLGIDLLSMDVNPDIAFPLAAYVIRKANPEITDEEIDELPVNWVGRITMIIGDNQKSQDIPF